LINDPEIMVMTRRMAHVKIEINDDGSDDQEGDGSRETEPITQEVTTEENKRIVELEKKNQEYLDKLKRAQADFENYRKRNDKEREEYTALAAERILKELLNLSDDFERALNNSNSSNTQMSLRPALEMMYKQLRDIFRREGVTEINTNCKLDPFEHEVMSKVDSPDKSEGDIVECLQKGYRIGHRVIRPARVVVCHQAEEIDKENDDNEDDDQEDQHRWIEDYIDTDE